MLFFKLSIALLAPLAVLAVPVSSSASHYRRQGVIPEGISLVPNPDPTGVGVIVDGISLVPAPTGLTSEPLDPGPCDTGVVAFC
jgi:hypothetical protein